MPTDNEQQKVEKALQAIGSSRLPLSRALIEGLQSVLLEKGYDEAVVYAEQTYLAADENAELVRVLMICRRYGLTPEAAARIFDRLSRESGGTAGV